MGFDAVGWKIADDDLLGKQPVAVTMTSLQCQGGWLSVQSSGL